jgi:hypothetical protein
MKQTRLVLVAVGGLSAAMAALFACDSSDDTVITEDASVPETSTPPAVDSGPVTDGSGPVTDGGFDAGIKPNTFVSDYATAYCQTLARCCWGNPEPGDASIDGGGDGGTFDIDKCMTVASTGFDSSHAHLNDVDAAAVVLDQKTADDCVSAIKTLTCTVSGATFNEVRTTCFNSL